MRNGPTRGSSVTAQTPRRTKHADEIDNIIRSIEAEWSLGLSVPGDWSPKSRNSKDLRHNIYERIQRNYFRARNPLDGAIEKFRANAKTYSHPDGQLTYLHVLLSQIVPSHPASKTGGNRFNSFDSKAEQSPLEVSQANESSAYETADSGSTTDEDELKPPCSPSPSSRKRTGDDVDQSCSPSKHFKSLKEIAPGTMATLPKPTRRILSFQELIYPSSAETSFVNSATSTPRHEPNTANTSFMTDIATNNNSSPPDMVKGNMDQPQYPPLPMTHASERSSQDTVRGPVIMTDARSCDTTMAQKGSSENTLGEPPSSYYGSVDEEQLAAVAAVQDVPSPSKKQAFYIRDIPRQHLFDENIGRSADLPFFMLFICHTLASDSLVSLNDFLRETRIAAYWPDSDGMVSAIRSQANPRISQVAVPDFGKLQESAKTQFDGFTFKCQIFFNQKHGSPLMGLRCLPLLADKSCRFQRKFGADRFLYVDVPTFSSKAKQGRLANMNMEDVRENWEEWLCSAADRLFLGRKWRVFHVEHVRKRNSSRQKSKLIHDKRIILFATEGHDIPLPRIPVGTMLDWFMPIHKNGHQSMCKAFSRFDLALSRTTPTWIFKPSNVRYIPDIKSDGVPETSEFNDHTLKWPDMPCDQVMNDGCAEISVEAARQVWRLSGATTPLPSVFQGRIGAAKGVWVVSGESHSTKESDRDVWINVSASQLKFDMHDEDLDHRNRGFDPIRLTFELRDHSSMPKSSDLHVSFISIMVDRGVPEAVIAEIMMRYLDHERARLLENLEVVEEPSHLHAWVYKNSSISCGNEVRWHAALPDSYDERIRFMIEHGFTPHNSPFLVKLLDTFIQSKYLDQEAQLQIPLQKSTYVFGIADPKGVLKPGEIYMKFSSTFEIADTGESYTSLAGLEVLVGRHPACRRSDLQKVRAVNHPELSHLVDVVVFPSTGQYPLAGKLQGGDYDGDKFWLCWEQPLVTPFRNAPVEVQSPDPRFYGIKVDTRKLHSVSYDIDVFLREALKFSAKPSMLGAVTNFAERQVYAENRVYSPLINALNDLHDYLVDSKKNGYSFSPVGFNKFLCSMSCFEEPDKPAWKTATGACKIARGSDLTEVRAKEYPFKKDNAIDSLYFKVVKVHNDESMRQIRGKFPKSVPSDLHLLHPHIRQREKRIDAIDQELDTLEAKLRPIYTRWNEAFTSRVEKSPEQKKIVALECYEAYKDISPIQIDHHDIKPWLEEPLQRGHSMWPFIKASTIYQMYQRDKQANFVFTMAGEELAQLKANNVPGVRCIIPTIHVHMKPKVRSTKASVEPATEESDSDDDFHSAVGSSP